MIRRTPRSGLLATIPAGQQASRPGMTCMKDCEARVRRRRRRKNPSSCCVLHGGECCKIAITIIMMVMIDVIIIVDASVFPDISSASEKAQRAAL